jgi:hypothetical protein
VWVLLAQTFVSAKVVNFVLLVVGVVMKPDMNCPLSKKCIQPVWVLLGQTFSPLLYPQVCSSTAYG